MERKQKNLPGDSQEVITDPETYDIIETQSNSIIQVKPVPAMVKELIQENTCIVLRTDSQSSIGIADI